MVDETAERPQESVWSRWTRPHPELEGLPTRRRVRLAAALLLAMMPVAVLFVVLTLPSLSWIALCSLLLFILAYGFARTRRPFPAIWLLVAAPIVALLVAWYGSLPSPSTHLLYYTVLPIVIASLILDLRAAVAVASLDLVGISLLLWAALQYGFDVSAGAVLDALVFVFTTSVVALIGGGFLERSLRAQEEINQRLRESEAERTQLLHIIAHDLAAPIAPILLRVERLTERLGPDRDLEVIGRNASHMIRLIEDTKDLARIEGGQLSLEKHPVDLGELVYHAVESFDDRGHPNRIEPRVEGGGPLPVQGDPDRLNQVLYNLLTNAIKFSPKDQPVRVRTWQRDGHARVVVEDHGRGLTVEEMSRLFRPFTQVHERRETVEKGTGLGLYISKGIVEAHGGRIWVESKGRGEGSTFAFEVPLRAPPVPEG